MVAAYAPTIHKGSIIFIYISAVPYGQCLFYGKENDMHLVYILNVQTVQRAYTQLQENGLHKQSSSYVYIYCYIQYTYVYVHIQIQLLFSLRKVYAAVSNMRSYTVCSYNQKMSVNIGNHHIKCMLNFCSTGRAIVKSVKFQFWVVFFVACVKTCCNIRMRVALLLVMLKKIANRISRVIGKTFTCGITYFIPKNMKTQ